MLYEEVFAALERHQVRYVVVGGIAVVFHGCTRFTADLDLIVELSPQNLRKFLAAMKENGYVPRLPVSPESLLSAEEREVWIREKNLKAFAFWRPDKQLDHVDLLLDVPIDSGIFERAERFPLGNVAVSLISIDDLIRLKELADRGKDRLDIEDLKELKRMRREKESET